MITQYKPLTMLLTVSVHFSIYTDIFLKMFLFFTANLLELSQLDEKVGVVYFKGDDNLKKCFAKDPAISGFNKSWLLAVYRRL